MAKTVVRSVRATEEWWGRVAAKAAREDVTVNEWLVSVTELALDEDDAGERARRTSKPPSPPTPLEAELMEVTARAMRGRRPVDAGPAMRSSGRLSDVQLGPSTPAPGSRLKQPAKGKR